MGRLSGLLSIAALAVTMALGQSIPSGITVKVRNTDTISSKTAHSGDKWSGSLDGDIRSGEKTIAHKGDPVEGVIKEVQSSGRLSKPGSLTLELTSINGQAVSTNAWSDYWRHRGRRQGRCHRSRHGRGGRNSRRGGNGEKGRPDSFRNRDDLHHQLISCPAQELRTFVKARPGGRARGRGSPPTSDLEHIVNN
jgi:hypothetical protein